MRTGNHQSANYRWNVQDTTGKYAAADTDHAILAVLMDIREELRGVSGRLDCSETLTIPRLLRKIATNTTKPRRRRKHV